MKYKLELINKDSTLDLTKKTDAIEKVINHIKDGGKERKSFQDVSEIHIISIQKDKIELDVTESNNENATNWHSKVGQFLAQNCGMREYCDPNNSQKMFKWTK